MARIRIADGRLEALISEDVPYIDLTTEVLGIGDEPGEMQFFTRDAGVLAGVEYAARMAQLTGCEVVSMRSSGERMQPGDVVLTVRGSAASLHEAWKVCLNTLDHLSGVATKTRAMVDAAHAANPRCEVLTTRKSLPGAKDLLTSAVMAGGAFPHRLGLSETVLVFGQHLEFLGGFEALLQKLPEIKARCIEKKLFVEVTAEQALALARAGVACGSAVDGIQFDKVPAAELSELVFKLREIDPHLTLIAAGGVNAENVGDYAASGVDGVATTAPFNAKPLDMSARMVRL
jgi:molybdenum transport protein